MTDALNRWMALIENPRIYDDDWIVSTATEMVTVRKEADDLVNINPVPDDMQAIHELTVLNRDDLYAATDHFANGINYMRSGDSQAEGEFAREHQTGRAGSHDDHGFRLCVHPLSIGKSDIWSRARSNAVILGVRHPEERPRGPSPA